MLGLALMGLPRHKAELQDRLARSTRLLCELILDPVNNFTRVPAPASLERRTPFAPLVTTITVNYDAAFQANAAARNAFQAAVDIWSTQIVANVPITIDAKFEALGQSVLGQAYFNNTDFGSPAPIPNTWYPIPIFNQYVGFDPQPGTVQISAIFSSNRTDWYFGTDGATPQNNIDFESVVLHEITHGLGFAASMDVSGGIGSWAEGFSPRYPLIYDRFVANGSGESLIDTTRFPNPSAALGSQLTSDNLFWSGGSGAVGNNGVWPRLYAPTTWRGGSSVSHLDDNTFPAGNVNSLMTHLIGFAESIHQPGPIVRGMMVDSGWNVSCDYTISPTAAFIPFSGGTGTVGVTTVPSGCSWTATSNSPSFVTVTGGASGTGNGTVTYSVASLASGSRTGTITIAGRTFTINQGPTLTLNRSSLRFAGVNSAGTLTSITPAQEVTVAISGVPSWSAVANQPWVQITGGSGTASGRFTVGVVSHPSLPATGTASATITVTAPGALNTPQAVGVTLTLLSPASTAAPTGSFDTPANGATGINGSIAVTGWSTDDIGVSRVEIWRNCVEAIDRPAGVCFAASPGGPANFVFIGRGAFLAGARPDVEALFPLNPAAYLAGWGYLMATNALPHVPAPSAPQGGQGTFTLSAYAIDVENRYTLLGQKTIALDNDNATIPFGAIDTPDQGGTVPETRAGYNDPNTYPNFGWGMTQVGKCIDTTSSTAYRVYIDGVSRTLTPGVNWFAGLNRSDIAAAYPGRCNTNNALAVYYINADALGLANGIHTIGWDVIDNLGNIAGIGSRFFLVNR